jgi:hypothetical protein
MPRLVAIVELACVVRSLMACNERPSIAQRSGSRQRVARLMSQFLIIHNPSSSQGTRPLAAAPTAIGAAVVVWAGRRVDARGTNTIQ